MFKKLVGRAPTPGYSVPWEPPLLSFPTRPRVMPEADGLANLIQEFLGVLSRHGPFPPNLTKKRSWLYTGGVVGSVS